MFNRGPKKMSEAERAEAQIKVARAQRVADFLAGGFWIKDLGPYMKEKESSCGVSWNPGMSIEPHAIANQVFFNSGMKSALERLRQEISIWQQQGIEALKELKRDEELEVAK